MRRNNNCASAFAVLRGSVLPRHTRILAYVGHACVRGTHGRSRERGRCTERMHVEAPQSTATLRDRRFVAVLHLAGEKKGNPPACAGVFIFSASRASLSSEIRPIERDSEVRVSRCVQSREIRRVEGVRAYTSVAVHLDLSLCLHECELPWATIEFEESSSRNAEFQRQNLSNSITISKFPTVSIMC